MKVNCMVISELVNGSESNKMCALVCSPNRQGMFRVLTSFIIISILFEKITNIGIIGQFFMKYY